MGGGALYALPVVFCPLLIKSLGNPYMKFFDFTQLFIADAPMEKNQKKLFYLRAVHFYDTKYINIFKNFAFNKKKSSFKVRLWVGMSEWRSLQWNFATKTKIKGIIADINLMKSKENVVKSGNRTNAKLSSSNLFKAGDKSHFLMYTPVARRI